MSFKLTYKIYSEHSILVEWNPVIDKDVLNDILAFKTKIEATITTNVQVTTAYNSLLVIFNDFKVDLSAKVTLLKDLYAEGLSAASVIKTLFKIPVCYDADFGIDLEFVAQEKGVSISKIIQQHTAPIYTVYFIGFLPGFLYLGGLPEELIMPRKATPRLRIKKGAVAIGGNQTGVYPVESPGGWNIIGNSPLPFFDVTKDVPCFAKPGDAIQFYSVTKKKYDDIKTLINANVFQIESEDYNG
ncbi:5-oxoprolinase subunit PxpB [Cellulophaga fucicola]|uniref:Inhibitor of KinA n=1 Tax=Cellulophaga fucicola TaxID=76595 RepID=A0A1K1MIB4_9FLAO|nr:5-oxoprolinase subunit PxpB [Cellulophaga fucicola]SFW22924.1 inhibitor of KinA [Cellulophaga fucicola]